MHFGQIICSVQKGKSHLNKADNHDISLERGIPIDLLFFVPGRRTPVAYDAYADCVTQTLQMVDVATSENSRISFPVTSASRCDDDLGADGTGVRGGDRRPSRLCPLLPLKQGIAVRDQDTLAALLKGYLQSTGEEGFLHLLLRIASRKKSWLACNRV